MNYEDLEQDPRYSLDEHSLIRRRPDVSYRTQPLLQVKEDDYRTPFGDGARWCPKHGWRHAQSQPPSQDDPTRRH